LYLILIGVLIGPVLNVISPLDFGKVGHVFTTIALVVILFEGGLELSYDHLRVALRSTMVLTVISYLVALGAITALTIWLMQLPLLLSLFIGAVLAAPAPAVVIPLTRQVSVAAATKTILTLESPLGEALGIVVALAVLESIRFESIQIGHLIGKLIASFSFALVIGGMGGFAWSVLLHRIRQLRHAIFTTPAFILVLFGLTEFLGFSGPVSALTFGFTLANVGTKELPWLTEKYNLTPLQHNETERAFFGEIVFLIKTFFFVYLGLSATFVDWWTLTVALLLAVGLVVARISAVRISTRKEVIPRRDALIMGVMVPKGTAAAVLAAIPLQMALADGETVKHTIYAVVVLSIVTSAFLLFLIERTPFEKVLGSVFSGYVARSETAEDAGVPMVSARTE
jgi:NhaP-type Na+/H+ or K+/H+ antiporter